MKYLLIAAGFAMAITTTGYWLLGRAIVTMDDWVNEPDTDDWDDPEYD